MIPTTSIREANEVAREYVAWAKQAGYQAPNILAMMRWRGVGWRDVERGVERWWIARHGLVRPEGHALTASECEAFAAGLLDLGDCDF